MEKGDLKGRQRHWNQAHMKVSFGFHRKERKWSFFGGGGKKCQVFKQVGKEI